MTTRPTHLPNAPIVEAMIAFDFETQDKDQTSIWDRFHKAIEADYPTRIEIKQAEVTFNEQGSSGGTTETTGARFINADGKRVCIINKATFLCSRLTPYENWMSLKSEFERLWKIFSSLTDTKLVKVAVRYINKLSIPAGQEMSLTLKTRPEIAVGLPQQMFNVWVRLEVVIPEPRGILIITEVQLPPEKEGFVPFVLDHDLQFQIAPETDVWALLEAARELKNQYFFASISDDLLKEYL
jgi:uncharacterized protein (TIGR04255 family)